MITKWVVSQFRNGHSVSQPMTISQIAPMTAKMTRLAVGSQLVLLTTAEPNDAAALATISDDDRPEQPLPVRVPVQDHLLVAGQHVLGVAHAGTLNAGA